MQKSNLLLILIFSLISIPVISASVNTWIDYDCTILDKGMIPICNDINELETRITSLEQHLIYIQFIQGSIPPVYQQESIIDYFTATIEGTDISDRIILSIIAPNGTTIYEGPQPALLTIDVKQATWTFIGTVDTKSSTYPFYIEGPNDPPIAIISPFPETVLENIYYYLNARSSYDPDGEIIDWEWKQTEGPYIYLGYTESDATIRTYDVTENSTATIELTVTDDKQATDTTSVTFTIVDSN